MRIRGALAIGATILLLVASPTEPRASDGPLVLPGRASLLEEYQRRSEVLRERLQEAAAGLQGTLDRLRNLRARELTLRATLAERAAELGQLERALAQSAAIRSAKREVVTAAVLRGVRRLRESADDRAPRLAEIRKIALTRRKRGETPTDGALRRALERAVESSAAEMAELDWLDGRAAILQQALASRQRELGELALVLDEAERRLAALSGALARSPGIKTPVETAARSWTVGLPEASIVGQDGPREGPGTDGITRLPVQGEVRRRFGDRHGGQRSRGMLLSGHPQPVLAPGRGTVAYAGPFRGLGLLLIIDHGADYHSLVIGASRLEVTVGDPVRDGQVVGWLEGGAAEEAELYLELRRAGEPIDPMVVLSARESEVRG